MRFAHKFNVPLKRLIFQRDASGEKRSVCSYNLLDIGKLLTIPGEPGTGKTCFLQQIRMDSANYVSTLEHTASNHQDADIEVAYSECNVIERIKPQRNRDLWDGMNSIHRNNYTKELESRGLGVYIVLWFNRKTYKGRYHHHPPDNPYFPTFQDAPSTATDLNFLLLVLITESRRNEVRVFVLGLEINND